MGCSTSRPLLQTRIQQEKARGGTKRMLVDPREETISHTIDQELNRLRQREEMKVKLLLLGLEGSGKRSIFQQMKYLHGGRPSDEERRTYGVIIRSNVLVTIRELCRRLRYLGLEKDLARETADDESDSDLTPKRAYDCIVARTLDASLNCDNREVEMVCKRRTNVLQQLEVLVQTRIATPQRRMGHSHLNPFGSPKSVSFSPALRRDLLLDQVNAINDLLVAQLDGYTSIVPEEFEMPRQVDGRRRDWVGSCPRAGEDANTNAKLFLKLWKPIEVLWNSMTMRKIWSSSSQHEVSASYRRHVHYLNDVARIASTFFYPTPQDMLLSCSDFPPAMTNAFRVDGIDFEIYNVFGQKSKRRKWINSFSDVDAIVFVAALSDYDETNATTGANRMSEALALFRSICCSPMFRDTSTILLLNKKDIFAEKILTSDIADQPAFSDYNGPDQDFASGTSYFIRKFKKCLPRLARNSTFVHVTSHTDPGTVDFVADSTRTIIMTENLRRSGFLGPG